MKFNKSMTVRFIHNGKQELLRILFCELYYDRVPIYYSSDTHGLKLIKLADDSMFIVVNNEYKNKLTPEQFEVEVLHNIIEESKGTSVADLYCAYFIGFTETINKIRNLSNISKEHKDARIQMLEKFLLENVNINVHDIDYIIKNLKFVEVNGLEI